MANKEQRRVVCAAHRSKKNGRIIICARHHDELFRVQRNALQRWWNRNRVRIEWVRAEQGFIDQWDQFMTRTEAWKIAEAAGQILFRCGGDTADGGTLFSENLY